MHMIRSTTLACVVAAVAMLPLHADAQVGSRSQTTFFTFSQPVELPGTTLPAGTYLFQLADSQGNRHIVRVMSEDRQQLHTTLLAIPSYSIEKPSEDPQVRFMEGPATGPQAVKMWFYPGRTVGHEFIYSREQATQLAQRTGESVLTTRGDGDVNENMNDQDITRIDREGRETAADVTGERMPESDRVQVGRVDDRTVTTDRTEPMPERTAEVQPQAQPRAEAQVERTDMQRDQPQAERTTDARQDWNRTELPRTAGMLPLLALVGLGSLIGSRWFRRSRRSQL